MKYLKLIGAISIVILFTACGSSGLEGTYTGGNGFIEVTSPHPTLIFIGW